VEPGGSLSLAAPEVAGQRTLIVTSGTAMGDSQFEQCTLVPARLAAILCAVKHTGQDTSICSSEAGLRFRAGMLLVVHFPTAVPVEFQSNLSYPAGLSGEAT